MINYFCGGREPGLGKQLPSDVKPQREAVKPRLCCANGSSAWGRPSPRQGPFL